LYAKAPANADITADFVIKEFKRAYPKEKNLDDVFGVDSDYDEGRKVIILKHISFAIFFSQIAFNGILQ
jgi:hypothetical protein